MKYITIKGFEDMTAQQVFDKAVTHLRQQGRPSVAAENSCVYRGPDGLMCAAGPFLRDEKCAGVEGSGWHSLCDTGLVPAKHSSLVSRLQNAHDMAFDDACGDHVEWMARCEENLCAAAVAFGLTYTPPGEQA